MLELKVTQIIPIDALKVTKIVFYEVPKNILQKRPKSWQKLGLSCKKICRKELSKIAQSGHSVRDLLLRFLFEKQKKVLAECVN